MKKAAATAKIVSIVILTLLVYSIYFTGLILIFLFRIPFETWRNIAMKTWAKGMAFFLKMDIRIKGTPPDPPFFLVSNHVSYIDIVVLNTVLKTTFIAKSEVRKWPVIGFMANTMGVIFIDRTRKRDVARVNKIVSGQLNERQGVILFPEGLTSAGSEILTFRPSLLEHPASEQIDVSYAALYYTTGPSDKPAYKSICWWDSMPFYRHLFRMAMNSKIHATVHFGDKTIKHTDRKILARELREEVGKLFKPMVQGDELNKPTEDLSASDRAG